MKCGVDVAIGTPEELVASKTRLHEAYFRCPGRCITLSDC